MSFFNFIVWDASPVIYTIGSFTLRWYGLLFALGFLLGQQLLIKIYKQEGRSEKHIETLTIYMLVATVIGARLGHCLFYQPEIYLNDPIQILYIWEGGLASHGATVGILFAIYLYSRKHPDQSYFYVLDRIVIGIAIGGCLIRVGNLMNSEIIGKPTSQPFGFVFARGTEDLIKDNYKKYVEEVHITNAHNDTIIGERKLARLNISLTAADKNITTASLENLIKSGIKPDLEFPGNPDIHDHIVIPDNINIKMGNKGGMQIASFQVLGIPRHPAQLYEAISCIFLFLLLYGLYNKTKANTPEGRIFGLFVVILFSLRFIYEFLKEPQVEFEQTMALNMGQILSIPMVIVGLFILLKTYRKKGEIS